MSSKEKQLHHYISSIYLPKYFVKFNDEFHISFAPQNIKALVNQDFTFEELSNYISLNKNQIKKQLTKQLFVNIFEPMYFTVQELAEIQEGDEPFSKEELSELLDEELERPYQEMNADVIEYCLDEIERMIK